MRSNYIQSAIDRFNEIKEKDYLINPISSVDADIINLLIGFLEKGGFQDIASLMKDYKFESDKDILNNLSELSLKRSKINKSVGDVINKIMDSDKDQKDPYEVIIINNERVPRWAIRNYTYHKEWIFEKNKIQWILLLNPENTQDVKSVPQFTNKRYFFETYAVLKAKINELDTFMEVKSKEEEEE